MTDRERPDFLEREARPRERALAAVDGRFEDLDLDLLRRMRSAMDAPVEYLSALAWQRSVDVYDPAWPVAIRRAVIEAAPAVHRRKGSLTAVAVALEALGVRSTITRWYEPGGSGIPYTFRIRALARARLYDGPVLDARLISVVYATVMGAKPLTRAFEVSIGAVFQAPIGLVPVLTGKVQVGRGVVTRPATTTAAVAGLGAVAVGRTSLTRSMIARLPPEDP